MTGFISSGFGLSSSIFSFISDKYINPNALKPVVIEGVYVYPQEVANEYKNLILLIACLMLILQLFSFLFTFDFEIEKTDESTESSLNDLIACPEIKQLFGIGFCTCCSFLSSLPFFKC